LNIPQVTSDGSKVVELGGALQSFSTLSKRGVSVIRGIEEISRSKPDKRADGSLPGFSDVLHPNGG